MREVIGVPRSLQHFGASPASTGDASSPLPRVLPLIVLLLLIPGFPFPLAVVLQPFQRRGVLPLMVFLPCAASPGRHHRNKVSLLFSLSRQWCWGNAAIFTEGVLVFCSVILLWLCLFSTLKFRSYAELVPLSLSGNQGNVR